MRMGPIITHSWNIGHKIANLPVKKTSHTSNKNIVQKNFLRAHPNIHGTCPSIEYFLMQCRFPIYPTHPALKLQWIMSGDGMKYKDVTYFLKHTSFQLINLPKILDMQSSTGKTSSEMTHGLINYEEFQLIPLYHSVFQKMLDLLPVRRLLTSPWKNLHNPLDYWNELEILFVSSFVKLRQCIVWRISICCTWWYRKEAEIW